MRDQDTVVRSPHEATRTRKNGKTETRVQDPRVSVAMQTDGAELVLFFEPERAWTGDAELLEIRLTPPESGRFEPWRLMPQIPGHLQYARATLAHREGDIRDALRALRENNSPRRGLDPDFLRFVAEQYKTLVAEGEPYPIKALAEMQFADKSTASRWVSAARKQGFLPPGGKGGRQ